MDKVFDCVVIGAGPSSIGVLSAMPQGYHIGVATGEDLAGQGVAASGLHGKIRSVAAQRKEIIGLRDSLPIIEEKRGFLHETASIGGLANYWGQQFVRYLERDKWPKEIFNDYDDYVKCCEAIDGLFVSSGSVVSTEFNVGGRYIGLTPRLLIGTRKNPESGLLAMREAFLTQIDRINATLCTGVVKSLSMEDGIVRIKFHNDQVWRAKKVFLSAGVIGSARIAFESCADLSSAEFTDHAPIMKYLIKTSKSFIVKRNDEIKHFNSMSIESREDKKIKLFASIYRMSQERLSLSLAALGLPALFHEIYPPKIVDFILPIQIWTRSTKRKYKIQYRHKQLVAEIVHNQIVDDELNEFLKMMSNYGVLAKGTGTVGGHGFHYHNAKVSINDSDYIHLSTYLNSVFFGRVSCADASLIKEIGPRPHTLTVMAATHKITKSYFELLNHDK